MSTLTPDLLEEIALTINLGERLTLIIVFGPGYLAQEGLAEIQEAVCADRRVVQHRLDRLGPNIAETVEGAGESPVVVLVNGLERMSDERREQVQASMNLLRDTLNKHPAAVVLWVPVEIADEFRRLCADLFHWRTLTVYVDVPERDERRLRHEYLVSLASELPVNTVELFVRIADEDEPRAIEPWLSNVARGLLVGPYGSGKTTALRLYAARRAVRLLDDRSEVELPVLVAARRVSQARVDWGTLARAVEPSVTEEVYSWLVAQLASAPAVLLIDGLDELQAQEEIFDAQFLALVAGNPRLRVVLSTRDASNINGNWQLAEMLPLNADAIALWLRNFGYAPSEFSEILTWANTEELASNPLSLHFLLASITNGGDPKPQLALTTLIGNLVYSRLGHWDWQRGVFHRVPGPMSHIYTELASLAATLIQNQSGTVQLQRSGVLDFVAKRSGIIRSSGEGEEVHYGFVNRIFRDYFAGRWLAMESPLEHLARYAADPAWRLATFHALGMLSHRQFPAAAEQIWDASAKEAPPTCWAMRTLILQAVLTRQHPELRVRLTHHAKDALRQARRDAEPPELWAPVVDLVERMEANAG